MKLIQRGLACAAAVAAVAAAGAGQALASPSGIVISQVYGGGGNAGAPFRNDYVELFNQSAAPVSLEGWSVQYASATGTGNFGGNPVTPLGATLQPGQYYLVQLAGGTSGVPLPAPDATGTVNMSGSSGKVALVAGTAGLACNGGSTACTPAQLGLIADLVGYGGANFFEGATAAPTLSNITAAFRGGAGCVDTDWNGSDFAAGMPGPRNTASPLHVCGDEPPTVVSTTPADGAVGVAVDSSLTVTFSEPVDVTGSWYSLSCSGVDRPASVGGGPTSFTIDPVEYLPSSDSCTLVVHAANVADRDGSPDPLSADVSATFATATGCADPYTRVPEIQGDGPVAAITGAVTTQGVVVGDYEGPSPHLRGFYVQDEAGDGDPATSDGIFVFEGNADTVSPGDVVRVSGTAEEYQGQTEIGSVTSIVACGTGTVAPTDMTLPFPDAGFPERYEGMLVRMPQTLTVTEHFQLGRFGQVVLSSGGRLEQPTNVVRPGAPAAALQAENDLNRIVLDDATNDQNPDPVLFGRFGDPLSAANTLRGGDTATGIVGVMTYTWAGNSASGNAYRVRPVGALGGGVPPFAAANPRPAGPPDVGGTLQVAGMNLLNFFDTFTGCTNGVGGEPTDCRGASNAAELSRQWHKTVAAITGTGADVVGVTEVENDGYGPGSSIRFLVDRLNEATAPGTYAFVDADGGTGQVNALGTDAIKVGLLYKPAAVTPIGATAALNTTAFVNGGDSAARNRPALAQAFQDVRGGRFVVAVNHLKSKGSACDAPDALDGQSNCAAVRTQAARDLAAWLASDPTGAGTDRVLVVGDLNSYAMEDPIAALEADGFTNLLARFTGASAYSYAFDGQWGYLDHALASPALVPDVTGAGEWHVNADEPSVLDYNVEFKSAGQVASFYAPDAFRAADHDPILVGLDLGVVPVTQFVTGGGWVSTAAGKASFELSAKYHDFPAGPDGDTVFSAPGVAFASTAYDWLTVSGGRAQLAGTGTLAGVPGYAFRLTVVDDGKADGFRIRIWKDGFAYDSGTLPLGGGNVTVHP